MCFYKKLTKFKFHRLFDIWNALMMIYMKVFQKFKHGNILIREFAGFEPDH